MKKEGIIGKEVLPTRIETLKDFYEFMWRTVPIRRAAVHNCLQGEPNTSAITALQQASDVLAGLPRTSDGVQLLIDQTTTTSIDISYEQTELQKDLLFLQDGQERLYESFRAAIPTFDQEVNDCLKRLPKDGFQSFVSDRDGTVNNYCARYLSSVQSIYNAVFLTRFATHGTRNAVIVTSAPLDKGGLVDISVGPDDAFVYAGSKGREFRRPDGARQEFRIPAAQQEKLTDLNAALEELVTQPAYRVFTLIGSGFQRKFGQTTIARQDIVKSIPEEKSRALLDKVTDLVSQKDPSGDFFRIEDTGNDIEIMLTVKSEDAAEGLKDFDKGDGVLFLDKALDLHIDQGPNLICGDTPSDVPMLEQAHARSERTWGVFVTTKEPLRRRLEDLTERVIIVSTPDILVAALNHLGKQ